MKENIKILYITNSRMPTEKAHGIQISQMCEAFSKSGVDIELLIPKRINVIKDNIFEYYNVKDRFKVKKIFNIDTINIIKNKFGFIIQSTSFALSVLFFLFRNNYKGIIYSRDQFSLFLLSFFKRFDLFYEVHNLPKENKRLFKKLLKRVKFVAISHGLKNKLLEFGVDSKKILVAPDSVDLENFENIKQNKESLRKELDISQDKKAIMYVGHLYGWKGADILLQSSKYLPEYIFYFIGGLPSDIEIFFSQIKEMNVSNVKMLGHKNFKDIPKYLKTADVLVLPNSGKQKISSHYTSPMKLFEYMASGVPIVASNLPSICEILNNSNAVLVEADNVQKLAQGIKTILSDDLLYDKISHKALQDIKQYTWKARVKNILEFIENFK